ncbi:hypothetical protein [Streptomyces uncialis]|uniref:hypothetical protein n=1 Tax=Streptomyces uncialis TaxID=1048205 RepID=UPI00225B064F|nr:hypothetical protein [Streptomyces uncialis]MCX4659207.1 hypothetical protein [Streptomyces uncialis]
MPQPDARVSAIPRVVQRQLVHRLMQITGLVGQFPGERNVVQYRGGRGALADTDHAQRVVVTGEPLREGEQPLGKTLLGPGREVGNG